MGNCYCYCSDYRSCNAIAIVVSFRVTALFLSTTFAPTAVVAGAVIFTIIVSISGNASEDTEVLNDVVSLQEHDYLMAPSLCKSGVVSLICFMIRSL